VVYGWIDNDQWCLYWVHMVGNTRAYSIVIYLVFLFRISFDQNGFHANPKHLVGHSYVIFDNHVSPPVYLLFRIFALYLAILGCYIGLGNSDSFLCIRVFDKDQ
jgi:hypothetical protein